MAILVGDRIGETTTTTGTGTLTLTGTNVTAHRTFAASVTAGGANNITDGGSTRILIVAVDSNGNPSGVWEVCETVFTVSGNTATRGTLKASSTGSRISFAAGTKHVYVVSDADFINALPTLASINVWTATQRGTVTALTSTTNSIAIELNTTNNFSHTLTENTTLANPTSTPVVGQTGSIIFTQHASAAKTLAFGSQWKSSTGTAGVISTTVGTINLMTYQVVSTTEIIYNWVTKGVA